MFHDIVNFNKKYENLCFFLVSLKPFKKFFLHPVYCVKAVEYRLSVFIFRHKELYYMLFKVFT